MAENKSQKTLLKAYEDTNFLNSADARILRMLAEFLQPQGKFKKLRIMDTIVFFGSARLMSKRDAVKVFNESKTVSPHDKSKPEEESRKAQYLLEMSKYYEDAVELSRRLTEWSMNLKTQSKRFIICTGGGPGIMEAANKGAKLAGGYSIGLNISIPFEQFVNKFVTPELSFEFHYFFMRKFWFAYLAKALVVFPGGFGTMDEFFELLTLIQTQKIKKKLLLVVYDKKYWSEIINFDGLVDRGVINKADLNLFSFCNTIDEVFELITSHFQKNYLDKKETEGMEPNLIIK